MSDNRFVSMPRALSAVERIAGNGGPVMLSVPHSGRDYPADLLARSRLGLTGLQMLEDPLVDQLVQGVVDRGFGAVIARAPRAMIDVNRSLEEIDPAAIVGRDGEPTSPRARAGLGVIPTRLGGSGHLWRAPIGELEYDRRVAEIYRPYHDSIASELESRRAAWGEVILIDCHSMPPRPPGQANVVFGDRHGTSAAPWVVEAAEAIARRRGFAVARNAPFAGGHIVERHGEPARGIHAIQVEIDRSTYCRRDCRTPGPGFDRVAMLFEALASGLNDMLSGEDHIAAE